MKSIMQYIIEEDVPEQQFPDNREKNFVDKFIQGREAPISLVVGSAFLGKHAYDLYKKKKILH